MNPFSKFFGNIAGGGIKEAGEGIKTSLEGIGSLAGSIRSALTGEITAEKKAELLLNAQELDKLVDKATNDLNLADAQSGSLFKGGWRPALGWICDIAIFLYYIPRFIVGTYHWSRIAWESKGVLPPMPEMGIADIMTLLGLLLGSSAMRMVEKRWGVASK